MIALADVKSHLRVDGDGDGEDDLIQVYIDAALSAFEAFTNRVLVDEDVDLASSVGAAIKISPSIRQGALLLIGHWYANREAVVIGSAGAQLPMATNALWAPHRWVNV